MEFRAFSRDCAVEDIKSEALNKQRELMIRNADTFMGGFVIRFTLSVGGHVGYDQSLSFNSMGAISQNGLSFGLIAEC